MDADADEDADEDEDATGCYWIIFCYEAAQQCALKFGWLFSKVIEERRRAAKRFDTGNNF